MKRAYFLLAFLLVAGWAVAQPNNPSNPVPLDGGLSLLIAGGAALGYKVYKKNREEAE